jgi:hypothetical protein
LSWPEVKRLTTVPGYERDLLPETRSNTWGNYARRCTGLQRAEKRTTGFEPATFGLGKVAARKRDWP